MKPKRPPLKPCEACDGTGRICQTCKQSELACICVEVGRKMVVKFCQRCAGKGIVPKET